ncbi:glycosyltransferase family 4 protein [Enterococcus faecalis]|uniref:glycosyltransferase family 4 protein n=1 Tax=Enterococcus faecalis TaxID=1351 RepID=UPI001387490F|nr:glycosyltransferase family 4 protein [Enterococcus faecalis]MEB7428028.1 glycosyltransferase family 4 protein [Enterococcus faecalis]
MKKNILIISQNFYPEIGSAANRIKNFSKSLQEKNNVNVLTLKPRYPKKDMYIFNFLEEGNVFYVGSFFKKYHASLFFRLIFYLDVCIRFLFKGIKLAKSSDVVVVTSPPIFVGLVGMVICKIVGKPFVLDIRDLWPESLIGVEKMDSNFVLKIGFYLEKKMIGAAATIIINSLGFSSYLISKGVQKEKICYLPNSLTREELAIFKKSKVFKNKKISIVYVGNIGRAQEFSDLVDLACKYKNVVEIIVIGFGVKKKELVSIVKKKGLTNVRFLELMDRERTLDLMSKSDLAFVGLKHSEVFDKVLPGRLIDCLGMGLPVIADVSGVAANIIEEKKLGVVTRNNDEWLGFIEMFLSDKEKLYKYKKRAHYYACTNFNWDRNEYYLRKILDKLG